MALFSRRHRKRSSKSVSQRDVSSAGACRVMLLATRSVIRKATDSACRRDTFAEPDRAALTVGTDEHGRG